MNKYSKNKKLNEVLTAIEKDLIYNLDISDLRRYVKEFPNEIDFNIAQYGNLLCYYSDIYKFYEDCGYKTTEKFSTEKIWETYKRQVGYVARDLYKRTINDVISE